MAENAAAGRASVLYAYALGKAQRVLARIDASIGPIVCHGAVEPINAIYREAGVALPPTRLATEITDKRVFAGALIVAPPIAAGRPWLNRFGAYSDALASGWMQVGGTAAGAASTAASPSPITPTGRGSSRRSRRPARNGCLRRTARRRRSPVS